MKVIHDAKELAAARVCLGIGFFDGVHLGHQQIIRQAVSDAAQFEATSVVITFDRHPRAIVTPEQVPPLIYSLPQRRRAVEALGTDCLLLLKFDKALSEYSGEEFVRKLVAEFGLIKSICVGANFVFGNGRSGNVDLLRHLGSEFGFSVHGLAAVALDGKPVSSTRIREAILAGDLDYASQMLGRTYSAAGPVTHGDGLGARLGFPTANLDVPGRALPPNGVYAAHAQCRGQRHRAVVNIGRRPTLSNPTPIRRVEAHLIDFHGDLYGEEMELFFSEKLRDEQKFPGLDALRRQIAQDILDAQMRF